MTTTLKPIHRTVTPFPKASFGKEGPQTVTPEQLLLQRAKYFNRADRQREDNVWPHHKQQLWIDTMLRESGLVLFPPLYFNQNWLPIEEGGGLILTIEDGLQRLTTIYAFLDDKLKTYNEVEYRKRIPEPELEELPFEVRCSELPHELRAKFMNFPIPIIVSEEVEPWLQALRYRRMNGGVPLSKGEKLRSYNSVAKQLADLVATHPLFEHNMHTAKRKDRQYRAELALYLIAMKVHSFPLQMNGTVIELLAAGKSDYTLTERLQQELFAQLDNLYHVCHGFNITAKTDGIPIWMAGYYLQRAGCDFFASEQGCLVPFFDTTKKERLEGINMGNLSSYASMTSVHSQIQFWTKYKGRLLDQEGLVFPDYDRWHRERYGDPSVSSHEPPFDLKTGVVLTQADLLLTL